jgi:hypothetical protein
MAKKGPPQDETPPNQLEDINLVEQQAPPFCRSCNDFHEESTCPRFIQINQASLPEMNNFVGFSRHSNQINYMGFSRHSNFINNAGKTHPVSMDHWMQIKERSENAKDVIKECDNATEVLGKNTTPKQILEMARYKGVTYQRKGNGNTTMTDQNIPEAITPPTS